MALKTYGPMAVDWENRIDFDRLRRERLARAKALLAKSEMGALLCFDMNNVRYITATHIGTWAQDKNSRFTLLPQDDEPILWDFGSAARHHQQNCPWLGERSRAGIPLLRGAMTPEMGENQAVGLASKVLYDLGSEYVEAVNAISGERCNPHPHVFSDRVLRPGDPVYYDILHSYMGYRTCYYRCFTIGYASHAMIDAYKRCRDYLDAAIELVRPGRTTAEIASVWPKAEEFGFADEEAAFALQFGHGIGLAIWEKPVISRLVSFDHPHEIKPGMVFALETFWPSTDGWSAARIEEEIVVTATGHEVITRFPAEELMVAGAHYFTVNGPLSTTRENEQAPSRRVEEMVAASAKAEGVAATGWRLVCGCAGKIMAGGGGGCAPGKGRGNTG